MTVIIGFLQRLLMVATLFFVSDRTGHQCVWKIARDGSTPIQITHGDSDWAPSYSPDGKWIVYVGDVSGKHGIWRVPSTGESAVYITEAALPDSVVSISPNGKMLTSDTFSRDARFFTQTEILAIDGGTSIKAFEKRLESVAWSPDGGSLTYVITKNGVSNIWAESLLGDPPPVQLTNFTSDRIFSYAWSRDGKQLAVVRGTETSDIVKITNFRGNR
jgi:Tol biopolymer transport system component